MRRRLGEVAVAVVVALLLYWLFWVPVPAVETSWAGHTPRDMDTMRTTAADLDDRVDGDERVLSIHPNYYADSDAEPFRTSRVWHIVNPYNFGAFGGGAEYRRLKRELTGALRSGRISVVVMTSRTARLVRTWDSSLVAFREHFCRVEPRPAVYEDLQSHIYEYRPGAEDCTTTITVEWRSTA